MSVKPSIQLSEQLYFDVASGCDLNQVKKLVAMGADVTYSNQVILQCAIFVGDVQIVEYLMGLGCELQAEDIGLTANKCNLKMLEFLISRGMNTVLHAKNLISNCMFVPFTEGLKKAIGLVLNSDLSDIEKKKILENAIKVTRFDDDRKYLKRVLRLLEISENMESEDGNDTNI